MGLFDFFLSRKDREFDAAPPPQLHELEIDLGDFLVGATHLGAAPAPEDFFARQLQKTGQYGFAEVGMTLSAEKGVLDDTLFFLEHFPGTFTRGGTKLNLTTATTEKEVLEMFGEPYWTDRGDGEVILFYEYRGGAIELQFEFPEAKGLGVITLVMEGVLADAEQRRMYGVTKPWPPT
jgi:hypothetical protein